MIAILLFAITLSLDAFFMSISYGISSIKIPIQATTIISGIGTLFLAISLFSSNFILIFLSENNAKLISFTILFILGIYRTFEQAAKEKIKKKKKTNVLMKVYADQLKADQDRSNHLSNKESLCLGATLSLDSLASGVGIGLIHLSIPFLLLSTFLFTFLFIHIGYQIGTKLEQHLEKWEWCSGILLILLAITRLF